MKMVLKYIAIGALALSLTACGNTPISQTTIIDNPTIDPNLPTPPKLNNVNWKVQDGDDLKQSVAANPDEVLFTLTPEEDAKLNTNLTELQRYILQLKQTVLYYKHQNAPAQN